ncbi:MAG: sugar phosphate nucleotidyltransferase [Candidatus Hodarchaeota archaeon]
MTISAFILAAGKGKRLYPYTLHTPKPMLPILNKPILQHSIERLLHSNINKIGIIIPNNDLIIKKFINKVFPKLNPAFIIQEKALGTAHAVSQIETHVETDNFIVIAGDSLFSVFYLQQLCLTHQKEGNMITLSLEKMEFDKMKSSSTVDYRDGRVWEVREKPTTLEEVFSDLNSSALYIFSTAIFKTLSKIKRSIRGEYELANAINKAIDDGYRVGGVITDRVCHISNSKDLWRFNLEFLKESSEKDENKNKIGQNVSLPISSKIKNSIIGDNVVINNDLRIENTVILPRTIVKRNFKNALVQTDYFETFSSE